MITSMDLKRPRMTLVLPPWDLGIMLEALSKPLYELLWEASLKHLQPFDICHFKIFHTEGGGEPLKVKHLHPRYNCKGLINTFEYNYNDFCE